MNVLSTPRSDAARTALITAALDLFGRSGFDAVSTRAIAAAAGANIAAIAYHFGGKEGLRLACAGHVVAMMRAKAAQALPGAADLSPETAGSALAELVAGLARFIIASPEAEPFARFMMREQLDPSPAFDLIHAEAIAPLQAHMRALFARATGRNVDDPVVAITCLAIAGQVAYFRLARPVALRQLGIASIGPADAERIITTLVSTIAAAIAAHRRIEP